MRLRDAMILVSRECELELRELKREAFKAQANAILEAEDQEIVASRVLTRIITSCLSVIGKDEGIDAIVFVAFRYGMRVQRKLDNPDRPTSILDSPCALAGTDNGEAPDSEKAKKAQH